MNICQWIVLILSILSGCHRMHHWLITNNDDPGQKAFGFWIIAFLEAIWFICLYKAGAFSTIFTHE